MSDAPDPGEFPLCARFALTAASVREALSHYAIDDATLEALAALRANVLADGAAQLAEAFYATLMQRADMRLILSEGRRVDALKAGQAIYLRSLGSAPATYAYCEQRLRVGVAHDRVGLSQSAYLSGCRILFDLVRSAIDAHWRDRPVEHVQVDRALTRIMLFDIDLATMAYAGRQEEHATESAATDPVTALPLRGLVLKKLSDELVRASRQRGATALLYIDLDRFKAINDAHGHSAGDRVLRQVADIIRAGVRPFDIVGRLGGDEFVVALVSTDCEGADLAARRLRAAVAAAFPSGTPTASIGIAMAREGEGIASWIARADAAMYDAKRQGRDSVAIAPD